MEQILSKVPLNLDEMDDLMDDENTIVHGIDPMMGHRPLSNGQQLHNDSLLSHSQLCHSYGQPQPSSADLMAECCIDDSALVATTAKLDYRYFAVAAATPAIDHHHAYLAVGPSPSLSHAGSSCGNETDPYTNDIEMH